MITVEHLVNREVHYCASHLVSTLAGGYGARIDTGSADSRRALEDMCEQAGELCSPIDDWEEAATQEGWEVRYHQQDEPYFQHHDDADEFPIEDGGPAQDDWRELCEDADIEPYQRDVFEHWIVSDWLADKLEAKGEKVDKDFAGLTVWARTTTGQGIANDSVIIAIHADLQAA